MPAAYAARNFVDGDLVPKPDPTRLTTEQLQREIAMSREFIESRVNGQRDTFYTRLEGMDKEIKQIHVEADRRPQQILDMMKQLQAL